MAILPQHLPLLASPLTTAVGGMLVRAYTIWMAGASDVTFDRLRPRRQQQVREIAAVAITRLSPARVNLARLSAGQLATARLSAWYLDYSNGRTNASDEDLEDLGYVLAEEIDAAIQRSLIEPCVLPLESTCPYCGRAENVGTHGPMSCGDDDESI